MADPDIIRLNERLKMVAGGMFQLGTALLAAAIVKLYVQRTFGLELAVWLIGAAALMFFAWMVLSLLEVEN